jgi:predicted anti-sigma-YlaC factor YlaD
MFCDEVLELVEPIAEGEVAVDTRVSSHLDSCANCAAALSNARRLEQLLRGREVPRPSAQFTTRIMGRIRRDRWRREQFLDTGFNVAVGLLAVTVIVVAWLLLSRSGLGAVSRDAFNALNSTALNAIRQRVAQSLPLYLGAFALVATALGIWWWAEREHA